jgi:hypothetical protein
MVWSAFFALAPGQERELVFDYQLPVDVLAKGADGRTQYRLRVQKQPGSEAVPLVVQVALSPGAELMSAQPHGLGQPEGAATDLRTDREFEVLFREGTEMP